MKKFATVLMILMAAVALAACGGSEAASDAAVRGETADASQSEEIQKEEVQLVEKVRLTADYSDALAPLSQLALGTLQLEQTDLAVDETLAAELLPLWQALQSLSNSDVTAEAELNAVVNQIQDSMAAEQIQAIADMKLTEESITALFESGELAFGRGGFGAGNTDEDGRGFSDGFGGGFRGGFPGGPGDGTGGGIVVGPGGGFGGGPGGGFGGGPAGGGPGSGFGSLSENDIATRQAQFAEGEFDGLLQERLLLGAVIRLMQQKTGQEIESPGGIFNTVFAIVSEEIGLTVEEIQEQLSSGGTLAKLIEANDGDVDAVRAALIDAFNQLPNRNDIDAEQLADEWLGLEE